MLFVPAGERSEEEEADERKDNGDDSGKKASAKSLRKGQPEEETHIKYGKTMLSLKVFATQIRFSGS